MIDKKDLVIFCGMGIILLIIILGMFGVFDRKEVQPQTQSTPMQYIQQQRDSIKLKIITIDSLQHEKVIEVQGLNNDSTLQLFYKLIKE